MDYKNGKVYLGEEWICTDPDNYQFAKVIDETNFDYCQLRNEDIIEEIESLSSMGHYFDVKDYLNKRGTTTNDWYGGDIDVTDYDDDEIRNVLSAYGGILDGTEDDLTLRNQLIAECIFETYMFTDFC